MRVLTVANPCNTNCLIARSHAPKVPPDRWFAMTRLDQNRAASQLARKAGVPVASVKKMTIWGNHSDTQYPDYKNAEIAGVPATSVIADHSLVHRDIHPDRGQARRCRDQGSGRLVGGVGGQCDPGKRPLASCSHAAGDWFSAAVVSDGSYGIPAGLIYSFPLVSKGGSNWSIVQGVPIDDEARKRLDASAAELISERDAVKDLLGPAA